MWQVLRHLYGRLAKQLVKRRIYRFVLLLVKEAQRGNKVLIPTNVLFGVAAQIHLLLESPGLFRIAIRARVFIDEEHAGVHVGSFDSPIKLFPDTQTIGYHLELFGRLGVVNPLVDFSH